MTQIEQEEIEKLPDKYKPLTAWGYFGYTLLFNLPLIGFIFLIIFALDGSKINRRSFARSYFCILILVVIIICILLLTGSLGSIIDDIKKALNQ